MQVFEGLNEVPGDFGRSVVTLGNFDGVHRGHRRVLEAATVAAEQRQARSIAVTFDPHPAQVHRPETAPDEIMSLPRRLEALADLGMDAVVVIHYTLEFASQSPREFIKNVFVDALHACAVVIGHDVRFGKGNTGDLATIRSLGEEFGFDVIAVDDFGDDRRCSSTWVREALRRGDVETAAEILGRSHSMRAKVVHGAARGRELGFPTANLDPHAEGFVPADGIYAGWLIDENSERWPAAISVGSNPTFTGVDRQVEAHVVNRPKEAVEDFDLYGQIITVEFVSRLRGMVAYTGPEALVEQMCKDVEKTREILSSPSATSIQTGAQAALQLGEGA